MDKYQRKQISRWETKKAKSQAKFEERLRAQYNVNAYRDIEAFAKSYEPHPALALQGAIKEAEQLLTELRARPPPHGMMSYRVSAAEWILIDDNDFLEWFPISYAPRIVGWWPSPYMRLYKYEAHSLEQRIDVVETMNAICEHKDRKLRKECLRGIVRSARRLDMIRDELTIVSQKFRAIQNCRTIKEELMMNVWHPRRIERLLDIGGEKLLDNFAGV